MKRTGIQLTEECDLAISGDSIQVGDTLYQNQFMIMKAQKGEFKEFPRLGVGIEDITNDEDIAEWKKLIREEFAKDGLKVNKLELENNEILIEAEYD